MEENVTPQVPMEMEETPVVDNPVQEAPQPQTQEPTQETGSFLDKLLHMLGLK